VRKAASLEQSLSLRILLTIGPRTIETMKRAGGHAIAIEAGKTILIDREKTLNDAHRAGIVIVSQPS
jgi:DUF1009 family protein